MDSIDAFALRYTGLKSVLLVFAMAGVAMANRGAFRDSTTLALTVVPRTVGIGESVSVNLAGPAQAQGELALTSEFSAVKDKTPFQLDNAGRATVQFTPHTAGTVEVTATLASGAASKAESLLVMDGVAVPDSSVFVFGPKANAEVGEQVYVRGKARPGTVVRVALQHSEGSVLHTDAAGEWGGLFNLKPGTEKITVVDVESSTKVVIPVTVQ